MLGTDPSIDLSCVRGRRRRRLCEIGRPHVLTGVGSFVTEVGFADNCVEPMRLIRSAALLLDSDGYACLT